MSRRTRNKGHLLFKIDVNDKLKTTLTHNNIPLYLCLSTGSIPVNVFTYDRFLNEDKLLKNTLLRKKNSCCGLQLDI